MIAIMTPSLFFISFHRPLILVFALISLPLLHATPDVSLQVDWPSFLAKQDPVWDRMPANYFEGPFVGNGLLGAILFQDKSEPNTLRFEIGRTDVYDHRTNAGAVMHYGGRLPIGHLLLTPAGKITDTKLRVDLWNAEITGEIRTDKGVISLRCFTPSDSEVIVTQVTTDKGEQTARFTFVGEQGNSSRFVAQPTRDKNFVYVPNPSFQLKQIKGMDVCIQPLLAGSDYATAWKEISSKRKNETTRTVYLSVANRGTRIGSDEDALANVEKAIARGVPDLEEKHREWWHSFYPVSFVTLPDAWLESFYWIQLYKMASATRADRPVVDLMGPWYKNTVWAAYWQNLNTQLAYYSVLPSNHPELGEPLCHLLQDRRQDLVKLRAAHRREAFERLAKKSGFATAIMPNAKGMVSEKLERFLGIYWGQVREREKGKERFFLRCFSSSSSFVFFSLCLLSLLRPSIQKSQPNPKQ